MSVLEKDLSDLKLWKAAHNVEVLAEKERLEDVRNSLYNDETGLCNSNRDMKSEQKTTKERLDNVRKTIYGDDGLYNQVRDFSTTKRNLYWIIVIAALLIGAISNWSRLTG